MIKLQAGFISLFKNNLPTQSFLISDLLRLMADQLLEQQLSSMYRLSLSRPMTANVSTNRNSESRAAIHRQSSLGPTSMFQNPRYANSNTQGRMNPASYILRQTMINQHNISPHFRQKVVCKLRCRHCSRTVCMRGMKAILLADSNVELFSTDLPPKGVQLVEEDYMTTNCRCKIRDLACLTCGNPCETCLESCNNGHFWMYISEGVIPEDRVDCSSGNILLYPLLWAHLPLSEHDSEATLVVEMDKGLR
ncbi:Protein FAM72 domain-containing protein [Rozella allomycis CSF55]|uniref:Protein FAM72 domain-containing protein n=1 Tax=Rozella allomycis (strain CSF55) TaxID=988480 RepID=A0A075B294_ROZAC|nr:Protein FAM72 domain-containing protein [Rozella allomycis CSF55]|eukprot:EPZ34943.1 Protein FAM72 domain-containing protein [Rozella allomycis CSF55]